MSIDVARRDVSSTVIPLSEGAPSPASPVWQIGAEQGFLPPPVLMNSLDLDGTGDGTAQLLVALAERADVLVDFRGLANGTQIELLNHRTGRALRGRAPDTRILRRRPRHHGQADEIRGERHAGEATIDLANPAPGPHRGGR
jgi:hypothetical protein